MNSIRASATIFFILFFVAVSPAQNGQQVEGFDTVLFHYNGNRTLATTDYRGNQRGYMTASWWAPEQAKKKKKGLDRCAYQFIQASRNPLPFADKLKQLTQENDTMRVSKNMQWDYPNYLYGNRK